MQHNHNNPIDKDTQKKINTLKCYHDYGDDSFWDLRILNRQGQREIQLCSPLFDTKKEAEKLLNLIHSIEDQNNHVGFQLRSSVATPGKFRVVAFLSKIDANLTEKNVEKKQTVIVNLLNDVVLPVEVFKKEKYISFNKTDAFHAQKWRIEDGRIVYFSPSSYEVYDVSNRCEEITFFFKNKMLILFKKEDALQEQYGKMLTAFVFKNNDFLYTTVYERAKQYQEQKQEKEKSDYRGCVTIKALQGSEDIVMMVPIEILHHIGFFVSQRDAAQLACVNRAAAEEANTFNKNCKQ